jgi:predicted HTH domain antitoxin
MAGTIPDKSKSRQELAVLLFQQERMTLEEASRLAGMSTLAFQVLLADRPTYYDLEEFRKDLRRRSGI